MGAWKGYRYEVLICGTGMGPGMRFGMERRYCRWRAMLWTAASCCVLRAVTGEHGGVGKVLGIRVVRDTVMWSSGDVRHLAGGCAEGGA